MRIVDAATVEYGKVSGHREGDISFKRLISGTPGRADNFELSLVRQRGHYATPRHRHNYDQFRFVLDGEYHYAGQRIMRRGTIGYFPEGTAYGPQEVTDCEVLAVQFGGLSGQSILDYDGLKRGHAELAAIGKFEGGVFYWPEGTASPVGGKKQQDGYEAIWEYVNKRALSYVTPPRYDEPIVCNPDTLLWEDIASGVAEKACGAFAGGARMRFVKLEAGARWQVDAAGSTQLLFVLDGAGDAGGQKVGSKTAIGLANIEGATITSTVQMTVVHLVLPRIAA